MIDAGDPEMKSLCTAVRYQPYSAQMQHVPAKLSRHTYAFFA
jgi:hypothetical protein